MERGGNRLDGSKQSLCIISWGRCMLIPMQNQFDLGRLSWDGVAIRQLDQKQSFLHHKLGKEQYGTLHLRMVVAMLSKRCKNAPIKRCKKSKRHSMA